jgi:hypothetical protein
MTAFIGGLVIRAHPVPEEALKAAVRRSRLSGESFLAQASPHERTRHLPGDGTGEMYSRLYESYPAGFPGRVRPISLGLERADDRGSAPESDAPGGFSGYTCDPLYAARAPREALDFQGQMPIRRRLRPVLRQPVRSRRTRTGAVYSPWRARLVYSGYNGSVDGRIENALKTARLTNSDGAVIFAHWGCKATLGASKLMKDALEAEGLPALILDGDACAPANTGDGQLATRLEAFLEMLEAK